MVLLTILMLRLTIAGTRMVLAAASVILGTLYGVAVGLLRGPAPHTP